jgi:hypothetical protein
VKRTELLLLFGNHSDFVCGKFIPLLVASCVASIATQVAPVRWAQVNVGRNRVTPSLVFPAPPESNETPLCQKIIYHPGPHARVEVVVFPDKIDSGLSFPSPVVGDLPSFGIIPESSEPRRTNVPVCGIENPVVNQRSQSARQKQLPQKPEHGPHNDFDYRFHLLPRLVSDSMNTICRTTALSKDYHKLNFLQQNVDNFIAFA